MTAILKSNRNLVFVAAIALAGVAVLSRAQRAPEPSGRPASSRDADARMPRSVEAVTPGNTVSGLTAGACCDSTTGGCSTETETACTGSFLGAGTTCTSCSFDSLNFGLPCRSCVGGANSGLLCGGDVDCPGGVCSIDHSICSLCVSGPFVGAPCAVDADCSGGTCAGMCEPNFLCGVGACCVGGTGECVEGTDPAGCAGIAGTFQGFGTDCTPNCCAQPIASGADECVDAFVNLISVPLPGNPAVSVAITGDNSLATGPDTCDELDPDPVWWEAIAIDACATVTIDFSCMSGGLDPAYDFLLEDCPCTGRTVFADDSSSGTGGGTTTLTFGNLPAGTYYYPIYSASDGTIGPYQINVTVEPCPVAACCYLACTGGANAGNPCETSGDCPGGTCDPACDILNATDCHALGGNHLAPPEVAVPVVICVGGLCDLGSCCVGPGACEDEVFGLPLTKADCDAFGGIYHGGRRCSGGTCVGGTNDSGSCSSNADCPGGTCIGDAAALAQPSPCPDGDVSNFAFEQWSFVDQLGAPVTPDSEWGQMSFDITPTSDGSVSYLNVTATPDVGGCTGWIVRNYPVLPSTLIDPGRFLTPFSYEDVCLSRGTAVGSLDVAVRLSSTPQQAGPTGPTANFAVEHAVILRLGETLPGGGNVFTGASTLTPPHIKGKVDPKKVKKYKGMPGVQEKIDECGSGATARSFKWLSNGHGLGLPAVNAIKKTLLKCMGAPTSTKKRAKCKLKYIKDKKLGLEVHHWYSKKKFPKGIRVRGVPEESNTDIDLIDWLYREMCKGQDVEIAIMWARGGAHVVTLVGVDKKNKTIEYRDDERQGNDAKGDTGYKEAKLVKRGKGQYGFKAKGNLIYSAMAESPKPDPHATSSTPGSSHVGFGGTGSRPAIPAGFFEPGSLPFEATIDLRGAPPNPIHSGNASTLVQRFGVPVTPADTDGTSGTVDIEIVELSLVSIAPITVVHGDGSETLWNVQVSLSDVQQDRGSLTATKTHANGGTFDATLPVQPKFTFTNLGNPSIVRVLDAGLEGQPPIQFSSVGTPFVFNSNPALGVLTPHEGEFVPGVREVTPGIIGSQQLESTVFDDVSGPTRHEIEPPKKPDPHGTVPGSPNTFATFGSVDIPPIPAGFFAPGSPAFSGLVELAGDPDSQVSRVIDLLNGPAILGNTSALVVRSGAPVQPSDANGTVGAVEIEIVQLSLVSITPITVGTDQWDVRLELSDFAPPAGTLTATKTHVNGGTFNAQLPVQPRFTFTKVTNPDTERVLDMGALGQPPLVLNATGVPFVFTLDPQLGTIAPHDGSFVPGVVEVVPGDPASQQLVPGVFQTASGSTRHTVEPPVPPDPHATPTGTGLSQVGFGVGDSTPAIPAGFFGPGSDPFTGTVELRGRAIDSARWGNASTLVQRSGVPVRPQDPNGTSGQVDIEIVQMNLVSLAPITVTSNGGLDPELWLVEVNVADGVVPGMPHSLTATKTHANGGTFDIQYAFNPVLTFTRLSDSTDVRILNFGDMGIPPVQLSVTGVPFVHVLSPALDVIAPSRGTFVPGVREVVPGTLSSQVVERAVLDDPAGPTSHEIEPPTPRPEPDPHATANAPNANFVSFGSPSTPPIPADFFGPGSDPFSGVVPLSGDPFDTILFGNTSVFGQRSAEPIPPSAPAGSNANIDIEIVELSLTSSAPITVTFNGGLNPTAWDVHLDLSVLPSPPGQMFVTKTHANGGTFDTVLPVQPRFLFTRVDDPNQTRVLDSAASGTPPIQFTAAGTPWVHTVNPGLGVIAPSDGSFVPGINETVPGDPNTQQTVPMQLEDATGDTRHTVEPPTQGAPPCVCNPDVDRSGGQVDILDVLLVVDCLGQPATCNPNADVNCDGVISEADLGIVIQAFQGFPIGVACVVPTGACCLTIDSSCVVEQQFLCAGDILFPDLAGVYQGDGTTCDPNPCAPLPPAVGDDNCDGGDNAGGPCSENDDCPGGGVCGSKSRYLSFNVGPALSTVAASTSFAIKVEVLSMPMFPARVGEVWWAGPSQSFPNPPFGSFTGLPLECTTTPHMQVWTGLGTLHAFGAVVAPDSIFGVSLCTSVTGPCSPPKAIQTGKWGDVVAPFGGASQPNFADISATVNSFTESLTSPGIARTDMVPQIPNHVANFQDINAVVNAFKGLAYPFVPPACP